MKPGQNHAAARQPVQFPKMLASLQCAAGVFLMALGLAIGWTHLGLIVEGTRTRGWIVGYRQESIASRGNHSSTALLPVVEFRAGERTVRFTDWKGAPAATGLRETVPVLYRRADAAVAMIDRPLWNWLPWAPTLLVGGLLVLIALKSWLRERAST